MNTKEFTLAHYLGMEREIRDAAADDLNSTILDIARSASCLCRSLETDYAATMERIDAQAQLKADKDYECWLDLIDSKKE